MKIRKYIQLYKISVNQMFSDAGKMIIWIILGAVETFVIAYTLSVIGRDNNSVGDLSISQIITYYLYFFISWYIIGGSFYHMKSNSISRGELNFHLVKPVFPFARDILVEQGWKTFGLITGIPFLILFFYLFSGNISIDFSFSRLLISLPAVFFGAIVFALMQFLIGISTVFFKKIWGLYSVYSMMLYIFGGSLAPLALMPQIIRDFSFWLPFRYMFSFSVETFQNFISNDEIIVGYVFQFIWIIILTLFSKFIYSKALKKYESFGN